ncbi:hypothetical protein B296_00015981 [Ensete ventricosum]|uniref:Pectinesterase inhibitor domain-containing protein n=1 Tax=Ensete ventricosum TaxID=4639 RepID=A0A426ZRL9_ENSVE|nr:hypothetical protein B296_00015981 [Ensete ventricosum]
MRDRMAWRVKMCNSDHIGPSTLGPNLTHDRKIRGLLASLRSKAASDSDPLEKRVGPINRDRPSYLNGSASLPLPPRLPCCWLASFIMLPEIALLLFFVLPLASCGSAPAPVEGPMSQEEDATEFVLVRCGATRYPDLCFASLSLYAADIHRSPVRLARFASNVTLVHLLSLCSHVSALRNAGAGREAAALRDCTDTLGDAADQVERTTSELGLLQDPLERSEVAWRVSNAQTWMSAALTNEDTCSDGFQDVGGGGASAIEADVRRRVEKVKQYTSNALALVNSLVDRR